ncbi:hypothetical protein UPYG_G00224400 [Umbra pygmaea]|uniref:Keratinocyte-associated protein 3 n=1 Tax=Umbra pygmaea TaxID=75934 RepID=A0ABD0WC73_UMBPY
MVNIGVCCVDLQDNKALMKMGLALVLVGHVNLLLGALVHGVVLRNLHKYIHVEALTRAKLYTLSNIIALVAGLVGIIAGIIAIVLSKNKKNRILMWTLLVVSFFSGLLAAASTIGLTLSMAKALLNGGQGLRKYCTNMVANKTAVVLSLPDTDCPFDPTRVYETTVIMWVPLILMCFVEVVFSGRCFAVSSSFLRLCTCRRRKKPVNANRVRIQSQAEMFNTTVSETKSVVDPEPAEQNELLSPDSPTEESDWV